MRISKTEIRLSRLLAAVTQQTNKLKLVHYLATLRNLLNTLKHESAESSSSHFIEGKTEFYSRCIEELACKLDGTKTEDVWESLSLEKGLDVSSQASISGGVQRLSHGPSTSELPLFPSCVKRKYSPDAWLISGLGFEESGLEDLNIGHGTLGKRICLDFNEREAKTSEEPMHLVHESKRVRDVKQEYIREDDTDATGESKHMEHEIERHGRIRQGDGICVAESSCEAERLQHEVGSIEMVNFEDNREVEVEHLDFDSRLYLRKHQTDQENIVSEMVLLTKQIKEGSLLLGTGLHHTRELLESSELTIRHCLLATTSAHLKTGELLTRTQERECRCITWLSLLLMYFAFVYMVICIRLT